MSEPRTLKAYVVVGASYGDEGKGETTADICRKLFPHRTLNILTNGGSQRGHTVIDNEWELGEIRALNHICHHFGSGTFYNADNLYSRYFIVNPMNFVREEKELYSEHSAPKNFNQLKFYCDPRCRWSTPYDMIVNQAIESARGDQRHGSVGAGIWETICRYADGESISLPKFNSLDLHGKEDFLKRIAGYYKSKLHGLGIPPSKFISEMFESDGLRQHFIQDCDWFCNRVEFKYAEGVLRDYEYLVFENGQGLLLSEDANNVHTTPSNTGCTYAIQMMKDANLSQCSIEVDYITRPYITRHGAGSLDGETDRLSLSSKIKVDTTNIYSPWQGKLRYAALSTKKLLERTRKDFAICHSEMRYSKMQIIVTHSDEIDDDFTLIGDVSHAIP